MTTVSAALRRLPRRTTSEPQPALVANEIVFSTITITAGRLAPPEHAGLARREPCLAAFVMNDARVQLEGQLEVVEASIAALDRGSALLAQRCPKGLGAVFAQDTSPAMLRAEEAVRRLVKRDRAVEGLLVQLEVARTKFWSRVAARGRLLGARHLRPSELLARIEAEPVLFSRRVFSLHVFAATLQCLFMGAMALRWGQGLIVIPFIWVFAGVALSTWRESVQTVVTAHQIKVGNEASPLGSQTVVRVRTDWWRRGLVLEVCGADGRTRCHALPAFPASLARAIEQTGTTVEGRWWTANTSGDCAKCAAAGKSAHRSGHLQPYSKPPNGARRVEVSSTERSAQTNKHPR